LQQVAQRLLTLVRKADTIARYGGDEFVVLLPEVDAPASVSEVTHKIHSRLKERFEIDGHSVVVTACIGTATYPCDGARAEDLLERADTAMYMAKSHAHSAAASMPMPHLMQLGSASPTGKPPDGADASSRVRVDPTG
jgi:diguanylate cyclase (GGDEF)-like protein